MTGIISQLNNSAMHVGAYTRQSLALTGSMTAMLYNSFKKLHKIEALLQEMYDIGFKSLPIVLLASIFIGFISAWQVIYLGGDAFSMRYIGAAIIRVVLTELGPTLLGLVLAGRISAKLASEIGSMQVSEQINAYKCLSLDPESYLIAPRVLTGFIMMPVLFILGSIAAIVSSQVISSAYTGQDPIVYYNSMKLLYKNNDAVIGIMKSFFFGGTITLCGCYFGYHTTGGALGVGASTRKAVVTASIIILVINLFISQLLS